MGKTNKANRTKGNTRPSSSEHSAHLLTLSGKPFSGFVGFDSLEKDIRSYVPVTGQHSSDASDLSVDSNLRMVMRKMLKRDNVTRLKAVQEFGDLCAEKDKDSVKNVLPFWPRLFNKLALDYDRRIREATHQANGKLIANVKREIAPYLKNIMGVWLLGQNDLYAPAASAAQTTFIDTFPKNKQSEALMYCKNEMFSLFKDNLFEQTAKTMSDVNSTSAEDVESKYILVISATLQAMKLVLLTIASNEISNIQDEYKAIVSENKFWKFAKNKESQIRGSWYAFISTLCHVKPDIFSEMEKKLVSTVFSYLSESDPVVAPAVWESALHIVVDFENCWQEINVQKTVLPQLWSLLNEAGKGNAQVIYPCILPFLSKFPKEVISNESFLSQFFTTLKQSVLLDRVKLSSMECDAILTTFMECLQYISFCVLENSKEGSTLLEKVLSDQILPLVETSFYESKYSYLSTSKFYFLLGALIQKLEKKCLSEEKQISKAFINPLTLFWNSVYQIFCKSFDKKEEKSKIYIYVTYFFHSIFTASPSKLEKGKVRFEDESEPAHTTEVSPNFLSAIELHTEMPLTFSHIIKFIKILCNKIDENINSCYLKILDEILASTLSTEFLREILNSYKEESCNISEKASLEFFNNFIFKWVSAKELDESSVTCISDILFCLCSSVSQDEALDMLNIACEVGNPIFIENILSKGLNTYINEPVIQNWLKSSTLIQYILNGLKEMMESLVKDEVSKDEADILACKKLLLICLINNDLQETLKQNSGIEEILFVCKEYMEKGLHVKNRNYIIQISCSIIKTTLMHYQDCLSFSTTDDLLSITFSWILHAEKYEFSEKVYSEILDVWQTAISSSYKYVIYKKDNFVVKAAKELNSSICNLHISEKSSKTLHEILNLLHSVEDVLGSLPDNHSSESVMAELLENILPSEHDWEKLREDLTFSAIPAAMERKFVYLFYEEKLSISQDNINHLFMATKLVSQVFSKEIKKFNSSKDEPYFQKFILRHIPDLLWCLSYFNGNGYLCKDFQTSMDINALDEYCLEILKFVSYEKLEAVLRKMFYFSLSEGLYWALPFQSLIEKMKNLYAESEILFDELIAEAYEVEGEYVSLTVQILSHNISKEKKSIYFKKLVADLTYNLSYEQYDFEIDEYLRKFGEICCFIQDSQAVDFEMISNLPLFFTHVSEFFKSPKHSDVFYTEFVSFMSSLVEHAAHEITESAWHFMQDFLSAHIKLGKSRKFDKADDLLFLFQVSTVYSTLYSFIDEAKNLDLSWTPLISDELNENYISFFIYVGGMIKKFYPLPQAFEIALCSLLKTMPNVPKTTLFDYTIQHSEAISDRKDDKNSTPLDKLLSILLSDVQFLQLSAHTMLMKIMPLLSESLSDSTKNESDDTEDEEESIPSKLLPLIDTLNILNELMESMLCGIKIGECCLVLPNTEAYAYVSAYLFTWLQMLEFISTSPSQVRPGYVAHLEERKLLSSLFSNVCRLMPENPMLLFKKTLGTDSPKKENLVSLYLQVPIISPGSPTSEEIQIIACYVFCNAMRKVPASVRTWWNNLDKNSADIVNKFTSKYISGILCSEEIQAVHDNENLFKNMVVKTRLGSREVIATYTVDDFVIELCVTLPINYPLGPITAETQRGKNILPPPEWKHWQRQLTTLLNYQNGSILDGLNIWNKNLGKKFEGVEECMICYYILHNTTLKLPKVSCHTCRKKFHSACLYKWFHSINNTKCPLCRNEFTI